MTPPVTLVVSPAGGSMDVLGEQLARRLSVRTLVSDCGERFNVASSELVAVSLRELQLSRRLRRLDGVVHFAHHHFARYGTLLHQPYVVTVHDLIRHFDCRAVRPLIHRPNRRDQLMLALDRAGIRRASAVIAVSERTKQDLVVHLGIDESRIGVVPPGIDTRVFRPGPGRRLPYPYLLFVGSEHPRKNLRSLFEALRQLKAHPGLQELRLVKVGAAGGDEAPFRRRTLAAIRELGLEREVILTGRVSQAELVSLYRGAACLALPSLYEGFGLPPLEAMACGCPVVVSDCGALPETAGPGALVSRADPDALAGALGRVLLDHLLRRRLIARGADHVRRFSWDQAAAATAGVYRRLDRRPLRLVATG